MATLGVQNSYLPKCRICGGAITFYEWRLNGEVCRNCEKSKGNKA